MTLSGLALLGGEPIGAPELDRHPTFSGEAIARVGELLRTGHVVGLSKDDQYIAEAESALAAWHGVDWCLGTSTGNAALHAALIGLEITGSAEVITSPYSWGASVSAILLNNAVPVFADVDRDTGLLDPKSVEALISSRTRAILVVHIFGQPADLTALRAIADRNGVALIEDGSQAHAARHKGIRVGAIGDASGFSCMGAKQLASSEAGYLLARDPDVYWRACMGTQHLLGSPLRLGRANELGFPEKWLPYCDSLTFTYRLSTINAVLLSDQVRRVDAINAARARNAGYFRELMSNNRCVSFPKYDEADTISYYLLTLNLNLGECGVARDTFLAALRAEGLASVASYVPTPINQWPRLNGDPGSPAMMWFENIHRERRDYSGVRLPGCTEKTMKSLELTWNYERDDSARMEALAAVFYKVEAQLGALQKWERDER